MYRVMVVGGGITGLSAAYTLVTEAKERGVHVECTVVERDPRWGGKVHTLRENGLVLEFGPDALLRRKPWTIELCRRLGIDDKLVPTNKSGSYVRWNGRLLPLPEGLSFLVPTKLSPFFKSPLFSLSGKLRLLADYFMPARPPAGDESLGEFVRRRLGDEALERLAEPLLSGIYAGDVDHLSLLATFPQLRGMEEEHGSLLRAALAQRKSAAQAGGRQGGAGRPPSPFVSLDGGLSTLIEALVAALSAHDLVSGVGVRDLAQVDAEPPKGPDIQGTPPRYRVTLDNGRVVDAHAVVLTAPAHVQADLLEPLSPQAARELRAIEYASVAGAVLVYPREAIARPLDGTGYIIPRTAGGNVTACTWASEKWGHVSAPDTVVLRCHFGKAGREDVTAWDESRLIREAKDEVERTMGVRQEPDRTYVYRWPRAMPQYDVGHLERIDHIERHLASLPGVFATGAALRGIGVPDCVRQGEEAARAVLKMIEVNE